MANIEELHDILRGVLNVLGRIDAKLDRLVAIDSTLDRIDSNVSSIDSGVTSIKLNTGSQDADSDN